MNGEGVEFFLTFIVHLTGILYKSEVGRNTLIENISYTVNDTA